MAKPITLEQVSQQVTRMDGRFDELIDFMKENVAMKSEVQELKTQLRSEILTVADQVAKLQETVEIELIAPTRRMDRLERRMTVVERKLGPAT